MSEICQLPHWEHFLIILVVALFEAWLGKTDKVKSGSIIELIFNIVASILKRKK